MGSWDTDLVTLSETTAAQRENEVPTFTVVESKGQRPVLYKFGK